MSEDICEYGVWELWDDSYDTEPLHDESCYE
jgi:hypothetical protein